MRDVVEADVSDGHSHSHESAVVEPTSRARPISTSQPLFEKEANSVSLETPTAVERDVFPPEMPSENHVSTSACLGSRV